MGQYKKLLSVSRLPRPGLDTSVHAAPGTSRHIIVAHNNHLFSLDVYREGEDIPLCEGELMEQLNRIVASSPQQHDTPVGVLTS